MYGLRILDVLNNKNGTKAPGERFVDYRSLCVIAADISAHWNNVNYAARPYLEAMSRLHSIHDVYGYDSGESIIRYFLCNATTWRGDDARRVKAELKAILALVGRI